MTYAIGYRLGSGVHARAYKNPTDDNSVIFETDEYSKIRWLKFAKLIVDKVRFTIDDWGDRTYRVPVIKLSEIDYKEYNDIVEPEIRMLKDIYFSASDDSNYKHAGTRALYLNRDLFPIHKKMIEYVWEKRHVVRDYTFDTHSGNYLKYPDGSIIAYDAFMFF